MRGQGRREDPIQRSSTAGVAVSLSRKAPAPGGEMQYAQPQATGATQYTQASYPQQGAQYAGPQQGVAYPQQQGSPFPQGAQMPPQQMHTPQMPAGQLPPGAAPGQYTGAAMV